MELRKFFFSALLLCALFFSKKLEAYSFNTERFIRLSKPISFSVGPRVYWKKRHVYNGACTKGFLEGFDIKFDRTKRGSIYWASLFDYAWGKATGVTGGGAFSKAVLADYSLEGRLGYSIQPMLRDTLFFTPYVGLGYYQSKYRFVEPSVPVLDYYYKNPYLSTGFLFSRFLKPWVSLGLNFCIQFAFDGKRGLKIAGNYSKTPVDNEMQYIAELPFTYQVSKKEKGFGIQLVPFFEYRHYGGRISGIATFMDTRFIIAGINARMTYRF